MRYLLLLAHFLMLIGCKKHPIVSFSFEEKKTPVTASFRGLHVVNENCIWLSGTNGTILRSIDGGISWCDCSILAEKENDFRNIHAVDSLKAFVVGIHNPAIIYSTIDGGKKWTGVDTIYGENIFFNSMKFTSPDKAMALSDPMDGKFLVMQSNDGGMSWSKTGTMPDALSLESNFAASNTCIEYLPSGHAWFATGGEKARIFYTKNNGLNWDVVNTPIMANNEIQGIFSLAFKDSLHGVAVGGNFEETHLNDSVAAYTADGGLSWQLSKKMTRGYRSCVQYCTNGNNEMIIALGKTGFDYSKDEGITWHRGMDCSDYYTIRSVPGKLKAYAAGAYGRIAKINIHIN
ncbi:hypothetical protein E9993_12635 [Labilibacter sediminis]|nr:hypothetical protein E9993_12635 [Labilibacter sediminis]